MLDLKKTIAHILQALKVNYIIDEGFYSNNVDYYRKWNNGVFEVFGGRSGVSTGVVTIPLSTFTGLDYSNLNRMKVLTTPIYLSGNANYTAVGQLTGSNLNIYFRAYTSAPSNAGAWFHIFGFWK